MSRRWFGLTAGLAVALLAACSSSNNPANTSPASSSTASASASAAATASAVATTTDPCQLVTMGEASSLTGVTYGAGKTETTSGGGKLCFYGAQTTDVFEVFVGIASDAATAQSQWDAKKAEVEAQLNSTAKSHLTVNVADTNITGADRAAAGTFSGSLNGVTLSGTGVYLLKGPAFVAIVDIAANHGVPTISAMEAQASTAVSRLP